MRVAFAGTPGFARHALEAIAETPATLALVLTQPDRRAGRGMQLHASPVKQWALAHDVAVAQPRSLRLDGKHPDDARSAQAALLQAQPDVLVVAAYGLLLPQWVLSLPRLGCLNIHASLLPRWRGAAPIQRAIEAGDRESGVTIMQMDAGLDTGAMLLCARCPIAPQTTAGSLHDALAARGARLIVAALERLENGTLHATPQPATGATYAHKIDRDESALDWSQEAAVLERRIRAFDPFPGARTTHGGQTIKVWAARPAAASGQHAAPGQILAVGPDGVRVACGQGALLLTELQRPGGKRLPARAFLAGYALAPGQTLGAPS